MKPSNAICPTCGYRQKRSNEANRLYWRLLHAMSEQIKLDTGKYSAEQWHIYTKSRFIGCQDIRLPSGEIITYPLSSADLDKAKFTVYLNNVMAFAADMGVFLDDEEMKAA